MPSEIINAAAEGNLRKVKELVENSKDGLIVNEMIHSIEDKTRTALSIALKNSHWTVVNYLLEKNAEVESRNGVNWERVYPNALSLAMTKNAIPDDTLMLILKKSKDLNPFFTYAGNHTLIEYLDIEHKHIKLNLLFHELILRNDRPVINELLSKATPKFDSNTFKQYIEKRIFSLEEAHTAFSGINFLVTEKKNITNRLALELENILKSRIVFKLELDAFPVQLRQSVPKTSSHSLAQLFTRFSYLFYSEEHLPSVPMDSTSFQAFNFERNKDDSRNIDLQNPYQLKTILSMNELEILKRLYKHSEFDETNEAASLLGEILLYKSDETVYDAQKKTCPLLTPEEQKKCFEILHHFCNMSSVEKMMLEIDYEQKQAFEDLSIKFEEQSQQIASLQQQVTQLTSQNQQMLQLLQVLVTQKNNVNVLNNNNNMEIDSAVVGVGSQKSSIDPRFFGKSTASNSTDVNTSVDLQSMSKGI